MSDESRFADCGCSLFYYRTVVVECKILVNYYCLQLLFSPFSVLFFWYQITFSLSLIKRYFLIKFRVIRKLVIKNLRNHLVKVKNHLKKYFRNRKRWFGHWITLSHPDKNIQQITTQLKLHKMNVAIQAFK